MVENQTGRAGVMSLPMPSIEALLNRIVDYAGLFPPAQLDMAETVRSYAEYLQSPDAWMLGRLIVPVARLDEFEEHAAPLLPGQHDDRDPWMISAITATAGTNEMLADLERIAAFNEVHEDPPRGFAQIDVIELKGDSIEGIENALDEIPDELFPFFEIPISNDPRGLIATLVGSEAGAKVRTGGTSPEAYPSAAQLAAFIHACAGAGVPFKATAGLHHPLRHFSEEIGVKEFGFLNVFIASCLADKLELSVPDIERILEEETLDAFSLSDETIAWQEHAIDLESVEDVREDLAVSFGSCSFDEPREGLRAIGLV